MTRWGCSQDAISSSTSAMCSSVRGTGRYGAAAGFAGGCSCRGIEGPLSYARRVLVKLCPACAVLAAIVTPSAAECARFAARQPQLATSQHRRRPRTCPLPHTQANLSYTLLYHLKHTHHTPSLPPSYTGRKRSVSSSRSSCTCQSPTTSCTSSPQWRLSLTWRPARRLASR